MFVRGGGFIFRQPVVQSTEQMPGNALQVLIAPANESEDSLYEDDGETLDYRKGDFMKRQFHQANNDQQMTIDVSEPEGTFRPAKRDMVLETWMDRQPKSVTLLSGDGLADKIVLPPLTADGLTISTFGWSFADGRLAIKCNDNFKPMRFVIMR